MVCKCVIRIIINPPQSSYIELKIGLNDTESVSIEAHRTKKLCVARYTFGWGKGQGGGGEMDNEMLYNIYLINDPKILLKNSSDTHVTHRCVQSNLLALHRNDMTYHTHTHIHATHLPLFFIPSRKFMKTHIFSAFFWDSGSCGHSLRWWRRPMLTMMVKIHAYTQKPCVSMLSVEKRIANLFTH